MKCYDCKSPQLELVGYITKNHEFVSKYRRPDVVLFERYRCKQCWALQWIEPQEDEEEEVAPIPCVDCGEVGLNILCSTPLYTILVCPHCGTEQRLHAPTEPKSEGDEEV